jgi:putative flippase GtrA
MRETAGQAGRYLIGAFIALAVDMALVTVGVRFGLPVFVARLIALLAGVTTTYFFNRRYTFSPQHDASLADWGRYVMRQSVGTALNFAVSSGLIYLSDRLYWQIWGAILAGAAAGFCVNFFSARRQLHSPKRG